MSSSGMCVALPPRGGAAPAEHRRSAADGAQQPPSPAGDVGQCGARLGQACAQLLVADLDGHHRVLELGDRLIGGLRRLEATLDVHARISGVGSRGAGFEAALGQAMATRELGVGAFQASVRRLDWAKHGLLEHVCGVVVELLVSLAHTSQRQGEVIGRRRDVLEHLDARLRAAVGHTFSLPTVKLARVILFLHNRYRTVGGEERAVGDLMWLVREHLSEDAELLERDSALIGRARAAAGLLAGGLAADDVARAVRRTRARIVHAHNLHPEFGWRALAAARSAGARVVMHLHQYRLVCAVGVCFTDGADCTRCHGRNTLPGVAHRCRGGHGEAVTYASALAAWQRRVVAQVNAFVAPSRFAVDRLRALGAPVGEAVHVVPHPVREFAASPARRDGGYALVAGRLAPEKGVEVAIEACRLAAIDLVIAGDGPLRPALERAAAASGGAVRFTGRVGPRELAELRARASVSLVPSLFAETFGLSAAEALAAGLPVAASGIGALGELLPGDWLAPPGDAAGLARVIGRLRDDPAAGAQALARVRALSAPEVVAPQLARVYESL
jgi:glycosyltransferase involved in cell wall biosynthesis